MARAILGDPDGMALRAVNPAKFGAAMLEREIADLEAIPKDGAWTIFDRGLGDSLGFFELSGLRPPRLLARRAAALRYSGPIFMAPAWDAIFCPDDQRIQTWDEAVASGDAVQLAWEDAGYTPMVIPRASPQLRADFVESRLAP